MSGLKNSIKTKLQQIGWFVQLIPQVKIQYFRSGKSLLQYLSKQHPEKRFSEYKRLVDLMAAAHNHKLYQDFLSNIYPNLPQVKEAIFISKSGKSSRNRKIKIGGKTYFEKNYLKKDHELETIVWVDQHLTDFLNRKFTIPKIIRQFDGEFSQLLYLEYLPLNPIPAQNSDAYLIQTGLELYQLSLAEKAKLSEIDWPSTLLDFEKLFYLENILAAKNDLLQQGFEVNNLWKKVNQSQKILAHGDLHAENVYQNKHLIDLDNFGYYPIGLDAAFIYMFYFEERDLKIPFSQWIKDKYSEKIHPENWKEFERNVIFYCFLYFHMRKDKEEFPEFYLGLVKELRESF